MRGATQLRSPEFMNGKDLSVGHRFLGGLLRWSLLVSIGIGLTPISFAVSGQNSSQDPQPTSQAHVALNPQQIADLTANANAGDASAQLRLGQAYRNGDGVRKNEELAYQWVRKAAEQGNAAAENDLGTMYRLGEGISLNKEEAVRWYQKSARHGSAEGMFNLGTCHYNGDGVGSNEYTAYVWFLLAKEAGDAVADEAVKRSAATMTKNDNGDAYLKIAEMYGKGEEIPKDDPRRLQWLRKAADLGPAGKVLLAGQLIRDSASNYPEAMQLCKAAAGNYPPAQRCVGYLYRHGLGVTKDPAEAVKWYRKAAGADQTSTLELAEMYAAGEGTKTDRIEAFMMYFDAGMMRAKGAFPKAFALWQQMDNAERKKVEGKLKERHLDPKKVIALLQEPPKN